MAFVAKLLVALGGWAALMGLASLAGLLRAAELVVVPSRAEPFGLVALEALAAGRPLLVTDAGGLREVVPPEVPRVPPADPPALAAALAALLADGPRRARLAALGPPHAARFTWAAAARRTAAIGAALARGPARTAPRTARSR